MTKVVALVPIKGKSRAKTRLEPVLRAAECAALAENMTRDVLGALSTCSRLGGIILFGDGPGVSALATEFGCRVMVERPGAGLCRGLTAAAAQLAGEGVENLAVIHGDLPMLRQADVTTLLDLHHDGPGGPNLTLCPASRDGGTNALVVTPPAALPFRFGHDSARKHVAAAAALGIRSRRISLAGFAHDIDTPEDLQRFCAHPVPGHTWDYLEHSGLYRRLRRPASVVLA